MSLIIKIVMALWPFFKEMVLGNKHITSFLKEHKWTIFHILSTLGLFMLFVNQYLVNVHLKMVNTEQTTAMTYIKTNYDTRIERRELYILTLETKVDELTESKLDLVTTLQTCVPAVQSPVPDSAKPATATAPSPPPPPIPSIPKPKPQPAPPPDRPYLDRLQQLRDRDNQ